MTGFSKWPVIRSPEFDNPDEMQSRDFFRHFPSMGTPTVIVKKEV